MKSIDYNMTGKIFDIQRFSFHDGPGIRTIVFLKGCPLHCLWCSNPESQSTGTITLYRKEDCLQCGRCVTTCKKGAIQMGREPFIDHSLCTGCGNCVNICPSGALSLKGKDITVQQLIKELKKDATMFRRSEGGVTLSGGEPLAQYAFAAEVLSACHGQGWSTAVETTGFGPAEAIETVIPFVDTVLLDIKHVDDVKHQQFTGVSNQVILKNALRISEISNTVVRVPVIPGFNYSVEEIEAIAKFVKTMHNVTTIHLLPYHSFGENKYDLIGKEYTMGNVPRLHPEDLEEHKKVVESYGFQCIIGG